ncbi:MAG: ATP-binding cassette domain-containing protein [Geobacteraceae bacterium]|nr:ATP-binding cassette domain-containing protein [Geobacteraceae bacterium]
MNTALIETRNVQKFFPVQSGPFSGPRFLKAVNGVSFRIEEGESLGLAGESGSGKSTLAKLLIGLLCPDTGEILFQGTSLRDLTADGFRIFRKSTQMIFQDPFSSLNPRMRAGDIIGEPMRIHGLYSRSSQQEQVVRLMERVGLSADHIFRYPHEFSGGQRQRIGIARALAVSPRLIIADEPVSALDLSIQAQIINLLQELKREYSLSFLIVAHDLSVLRHMCDRIAIMYLGSIVEMGNTGDVFDGFLHPYSEALFSAAPHLDSKPGKRRIILSGDIPSPLAIPAGCPFHTRCPHAKPTLCDRSTPLLEEKKPGHYAACHLSTELFP